MDGVVMATVVWGGGALILHLRAPSPPSSPLFQISLFPWKQILQISVPTWSRPREGPPAPPPPWPCHQSFLPTTGCVSATPPAQGSPAPLWGPQNTCVSRLSCEAPASTLEGPRSPGLSSYLDIAGPAFQCPWKNQGSKVSAKRGIRALPPLQVIGLRLPILTQVSV